MNSFNKCLKIKSNIISNNQSLNLAAYSLILSSKGWKK
jgi:hypothetical protein